MDRETCSCRQTPRRDSSSSSCSTTGGGGSIRSRSSGMSMWPVVCIDMLGTVGSVGAAAAAAFRGTYQPQAMYSVMCLYVCLVQLLISLLQRGWDPQATLDTPRFCVDRLDSSVGPASVMDSYVLVVSFRTLQDRGNGLCTCRVRNWRSLIRKQVSC